MAEESVKRFEAIMDKLFRAPPKSTSTNVSTYSSSNTSGAEWSRGKGTDGLQTSSASSVGSVQTANCRPWDRNDLFKRLATFKSMTWFAKPQAVSALNCARRGWINIDMDIIACESCGVRLLFATPSSWTQQQVEKVAKVFSLKLDSGHKLLCPWVDNTCDESLAQFPPKPTDVLVEEFKHRCSALMQLLALPVISSSAIDSVRNSQLQEFLEGSSGVVNNDSLSPCRSLTNAPLSEMYASYYQAQKLISLYGWEPHSLPYIVDCKVQEEQCKSDFNLEKPSSLACGGPSLNVCPLNDSCKEIDNDSQVSKRYTVSEPNSVVLNCKLCGASVGLWAFSFVPRPLEFVRLVGYTDIDGNRAADYSKDRAPGTVLTDNENIGGSTEGTYTAFASSIPPNDKTSSLNLTIAGGPPPEKQNYRATISLPVIGRNLRGRFSLDSMARKNHDISLAQATTTEPGTHQIGETSENMQMVPADSSRVGKLVGNAESEERVEFIVRNSLTSQIEGGSGTSTQGNVTKRIDRAGESSAATFLQANNQLHALQGDRANGNTEGSIVLPACKCTVPGDSGKSLDDKLVNPSVVFDPIRQHRLFCPWIASYGNSAPGWEQTLSALRHHKEISYPMSENTPLIQVDDPIASIKKLFSSPPAKRTKYDHES